ncbi:hypothetical protein RHGRI_018626 [Rhododendron griersonianum]|uniref:Uncharacterized protein n=1 Tax=Rhododendron griersonianum TaxID=479676 RepID=A0AAV6K232_9ERIC|nr:hypothetical protein RHGRI_018626 [Rhododendron griersonianum]
MRLKNRIRDPKIDETPSAPAKIERSSGNDRPLEAKTEVSLRQMDELSPHHPSGTVSFCQTFTPVQWSSFSQFLETGEALDDYTKFRSSLMGTYASLTMSIASDNKALMGWHCGDELERLKSYNVATNVRSSMKHDDKLDELLDEFQLFNVTRSGKMCGQVKRKPGAEIDRRYSLHLKRLHFLHQLYAYRKALAKLDFIKCDSDFDEVFRRLKSEKQWTDISDGTLRHALAGDKLLEAIENEYSQEVSDLIKVFKERNMRDFFSDHMEAKILQRKLFDQAESSRTVMLPKECHFTSPKLSPLIDRALVHRSQALEKFLELKGRWGRSIGGLRSKLWPVAVVFAGIPAAYIGGTGMRKG